MPMRRVPLLDRLGRERARRRARRRAGTRTSPARRAARWCLRDVRRRAHGRAVDRDDAIAGAQARALGRLAGQHLVDQRRAEIRGKPERRRGSCLSQSAVPTRTERQRALERRAAVLPSRVDGEHDRLGARCLQQPPAQVLPAADRLAVDRDDEIAVADARLRRRRVRRRAASTARCPGTPATNVPANSSTASSRLAIGPAATIAMRLPTLWRLNARGRSSAAPRLRARRASSRSRRAESRTAPIRCGRARRGATRGRGRSRPRSAAP